MTSVVRKLIRRAGHDLMRSSRVSYEMSFIVEMLRVRDVNVVFDVGANVGQWAQELRRAGYRRRIVSFEPVASAYEALRKNAARDASWTVAPRGAIGRTVGRATINVAENSPMSSLLPIHEQTVRVVPGSTTVGQQEVDVTTLDRVFDEHVGAAERAFLKIDTQGAEAQVLDGAAGVLDRFAGIQLEVSLTALYEGEETMLTILDRLQRRGFLPHLVIPGYYSGELRRQLQVDFVLMTEAQPHRARATASP